MSLSTSSDSFVPNSEAGPSSSPAPPPPPPLPPTTITAPSKAPTKTYGRSRTSSAQTHPPLTTSSTQPYSNPIPLAFAIHAREGEREEARVASSDPIVIPESEPTELGSEREDTEVVSKVNREEEEEEEEGGEGDLEEEDTMMRLKDSSSDASQSDSDEKVLEVGTRSDVLNRLGPKQMMELMRLEEERQDREEDERERKVEEERKKAALAAEEKEVTEGAPVLAASSSPLSSLPPSTISNSAANDTGDTSLMTETGEPNYSITDAIMAFLPPLESNDPPSQTQTQAQAGPSSIVVGDIEMEEDDDDDIIPTKKIKPRRMVVASDDEEGETEDSGYHGSTPEKSSKKDKSSARATIVEREVETKELTRKEKLEALSKKLAPVVVVEPEKQKWDVVVVTKGDDEVEQELIDDESDEEGGKKGKGKGGKGEKKSKKIKGAQSKKSEEEMHRETERLKRDQQLYIERGSKKSVSVLDAIKSAPKELLQGPLAPAHKNVRNARPLNLLKFGTNPSGQSSSSSSKVASSKKTEVVVLSSSSSVAEFPEQPSSSTIEDETPQKRIQTIELGDTSPISGGPKPAAPKRVVILPPRPAKKVVIPEEEDEEELPDLATMLRREREKKEAAEALKLKEEKARAFLAQKKAAAQEATRRRQHQPPAQLDDSDSDDLAIEGAPKAPRRGTSRRSSSRPPPADIEEVKREQLLTSSARKYRDLADIHHEVEEEVTESQLESAGRAYGKKLGGGHLELLMGNQKPKVVVDDDDEEPTVIFVDGKVTKARTKNVDIGLDQLNQAALARVKLQNHSSSTKRRQLARRKDEQSKIEARNAELAAVDVSGLLAKKAENAGKEEEDAEADDPDFAMEGSDDDRGSAGGSDDQYEASGDEFGSASGEEEEEEAEEEEDDPPRRFDAESSAPPPSSQPSTQGESLPRPAGTRQRRTVVQDDEDESEEEEDDDEAARILRRRASTSESVSEPEVAINRIQMDGDEDGGGGFTQLFGSAFSQPDEGGDSGFFNNAKIGVPQPTFARALVDDADLEEDFAMLEAQEGFRLGGDVDQTPRAVQVTSRRYINKHGLFTQTRPSDLFENSPSDSPADPNAYLTRTDSLPNTESQMSQTQLDSPTQPPREPKRGALVRTNAIIPFRPPTADDDEPEPTEVVPPTEQATQQTEQDTQMSESPPAAAPRNAFEVLAAGAQRQRSKSVEVPAVSRKEKKRNAFIDEEANLSEEENMGMGADSGDEDENGLDAELVDLVDHDAIDEELQAEQDLRAREHHIDALAKQDAENEAFMKRVADGKEREKRKHGGLDLDDDDYDDDGYGVSKRREKKQKVGNATMDELAMKEETQAFAHHFKNTLKVDLKLTEVNYLLETQESDNDEDGSGTEAEGDEDAYESEDTQIDATPAPRRKGVEKISARDVERLALEKARERKLQALDRSMSPEVAPPRWDMNSSPDPERHIKIKKRTASVIIPTLNSRMDGPVGDNLLTRKYSELSGPWKAATKEESQGSTNGTTAGKNSAVTSFKKERAGATSVMGGTLGGGNHGKTTVTAKSSTFSFRKKGKGFTS